MKHFIRLRQRMLEYDLRGKDLADAVGREPSYISNRMNGKMPFDAIDMDAIGQLMEIPRSEYADYFVPVCIGQKTAKPALNRKGDRP